jgi:hypothetical protein
MSSLNIDPSAVTSVLSNSIVLTFILLIVIIFIVYKLLTDTLMNDNYAQVGDFSNAVASSHSTGETASNQLVAMPGDPKAVTNYIQTQVAAEIIELTTLKKDVFDAHYSTPMYVGQFAVPSTAVAGAPVCIPTNKTLVTNNNYKRMFIDKRYASYDIRWTINVTGTPMCTGLMVFANVPIRQALPGTPAAVDPTVCAKPYTSYLSRVLALDHVIVDLSVDGVYTVDMPFTCYRSYFSTFDYALQQEYAYMMGVVMSPLLPATGAPTSVNFEVYATLMNLKFVETAPYYAQSLFNTGDTNISYHLDNIRDSSLPMNVTGDALSATATVPFGLDNPSDPRNQSKSLLTQVYQKIVSSMNVLNVFRASIEPSTLEVFEKDRVEEMRLPEDEMALDFFNERWTSEQCFTSSTGVVPIETPFSLVPSTATNNVLFYALLAPNNRALAGATQTSAYSTDFKGIITSSAIYWRGSLKYRLCIAGNSFKRGKILIAINYCNNSSSFIAAGPITTGELDPRSLPHIIIDLSAADRYVDIEVPYKSVNEVSRTASWNVDTNDCSPISEFMIGQLLVCLVSPLQVANGTASTVNLSLLSAWGSDMKFYVKPVTSRAGPFTEALLSPTDMSPSQEHRLSSMARFTSLKELLLTPVHYGSFRVNHAIYSGTTLVQPGFMAIPIHPTYLTNSPEWSAMMSMYCGAKGSFRIIARLTKTNVGPIKIVIAPYIFAQTIGVQTMASIQDTGNSAYGDPLKATAAGNIFGAVSPATNRLNPTNNGLLWNTTSTNAYVHCVLDELNQPETIVEIPDPSPLYKTQPVDILPADYLTTSGVYTPLVDRNTPWLFAMPIDDQPSPAPRDDPDAFTLSLYFMAGDDFRYFWYNGGPGTARANIAALSTTPYTGISNIP